MRSRAYEVFRRVSRGHRVVRARVPAERGGQGRPAPTSPLFQMASTRTSSRCRGR